MHSVPCVIKQMLKRWPNLVQFSPVCASFACVWPWLNHIYFGPILFTLKAFAGSEERMAVNGGFDRQKVEQHLLRMRGCKIILFFFWPAKPVQLVVRYWPKIAKKFAGA